MEGTASGAAAPHAPAHALLPPTHSQRHEDSSDDLVVSAAVDTAGPGSGAPADMAAAGAGVAAPEEDAEEAKGASPAPAPAPSS